MHGSEVRSHAESGQENDAGGAGTPAPIDESLAWLGWFRFTAIAGVVLIHVNGLTAVAHYGDGTAVGKLALALDFASRWSVPAFVMASGAMLLDPVRFRGAGHFLGSRAARLVPPLLFWHAVYAALLIGVRGSFDVGGLIQAALVGKLYTALYFFWIVLGLALLTPLLVPWVAVATGRALGVAGIAFALMPSAAMAIVPTAPASEEWVRTAVTWWVPYLGYFILGYALRRAPLRSSFGWVATLGFAGGCTWVAWQWRQAHGLGALLERYQPAESYFHPAVAVSACSALYLSRLFVRPGAVAGFFAHPGLGRLGRRLGSATLGVFAVHQLVLAGVERAPVLGGGPVADSSTELLARCFVVLAVSYVLALACGRIPLLRRFV